MLSVLKELAISFALTSFYFVVTGVFLFILLMVFAFLKGFTGSAAGSLLVFFFLGYVFVLAYRNIDPRRKGTPRGPLNL